MGMSVKPEVYPQDIVVIWPGKHPMAKRKLPGLAHN
jgi:hypothetical protein